MAMAMAIAMAMAMALDLNLISYLIWGVFWPWESSGYEYVVACVNDSP